MPVALTGLDEVVAEFREQFRLINEKLDALNGNGGVEAEWLDA
jgi:hypothetical protein